MQDMMPMMPMMGMMPVMMTVFMLVVLVTLVVRVVVPMLRGGRGGLGLPGERWHRRLTGHQTPSAPPEPAADDPFLQLRERYVRGELGTAEFEARLDELVAQGRKPETVDESDGTGGATPDHPRRGAMHE
ncbi:MAG: hypothetical protein CL878_15090 [Dehalococcoidia bacterium]|nr:hypothetical protein [Dehalococcoidia bacterium]